MITRAAILNAIGAAYADPKNAGKVVDPELATTIAEEVLRLVEGAPIPLDDGRLTVNLTPTSSMVQLTPAHGRSIEARVWDGVDSHGTRLSAFIGLVAVSLDEPAAAHERFQRELKEKPVPGAVDAWPLRMVVE